MYNIMMSYGTQFYFLPPQGGVVVSWFVRLFLGTFTALTRCNLILLLAKLFRLIKTVAN